MKKKRKTPKALCPPLVVGFLDKLQLENASMGFKSDFGGWGSKYDIYRINNSPLCCPAVIVPKIVHRLEWFEIVRILQSC